MKKKKILVHRPSLRSQLLGAIGRNGVKWPIKVRICFYLAKHLKTVPGTRKNHRNLNRTFGEGVDNYGIVHSTRYQPLPGNFSKSLIFKPAQISKKAVLILVLNQKCTIFSPLVQLESLPKIGEKILKVFFLDPRPNW